MHVNGTCNLHLLRHAVLNSWQPIKTQPMICIWTHLSSYRGLYYECVGGGGGIPEIMSRDIRWRGSSCILPVDEQRVFILAKCFSLLWSLVAGVKEGHEFLSPLYSFPPATQQSWHNGPNFNFLGRKVRRWMRIDWYQRVNSILGSRLVMTWPKPSPCLSEDAKSQYGRPVHSYRSRCGICGRPVRILWPEFARW
jgi:hypothetical protein